eukprot:5706319-Amphidinium_carterae.1
MDRFTSIPTSFRPLLPRQLSSKLLNGKKLLSMVHSTSAGAALSSAGAALSALSSLPTYAA